MNKKKTLIISSILFIIVIATLFVSYGYVTTIIGGNDKSKLAVYNSQIIKVEYSDGTETISSNQGVFTPGSKISKTFTIKNTGNVSVKYSINLDNITNGFERKEDVTYELKSDNVILKNGMYDAKGVFPDSKLAILKKDILDVGESKTYTLDIIYENSKENQIIDSGKSLSAKILIDEPVKSIESLIVYGESELGNIFDSSEANYILGYFSKSTTSITTDAVARTIYVPCLPNTTYKATRDIQNSNFHFGYTEELPAVGVSVYGAVSADSNVNELTITTGENAKYLVLYIYNAYVTTDNWDDIINSIKVLQTPTPENSVEIESLGEKTENLFVFDEINTKAVNNSSFELIENGIKATGILSSTGANSWQSGYVTFYSKIPLKAGTYTVSWEQYAEDDFEIPTPMNNNFYGYNESGVKIFSQSAVSYYNTDTNRYTAVLEITEDLNKFYIEGRLFGTTTIIKNAQIVNGEKYIDYEPYGMYKIPIKFSGKNLLNSDYKSYNSVSGITVTYNNDGSINYKGTSTEPLSLYLTRTSFTLPAGTYTVNNLNNTCKTYLLPGYLTATFTLKEETTFTGVYVNVPNNTTLNDTLYPQIEKGTNSTRYEQYFNSTTNIFLDEPLRKVGDCTNCSDYIDFVNKKLVRNVSEYIITGNETWYKYSTTNKYYMLDLQTKYENNVLTLSNYYAGQLSGGGSTYGTGNIWLQNVIDYPRLYIADDSYSTVDEFTTYLKDRYTNGIPIKVYTLLNNTEYKDISIPQININNGINNLEICSDNGVCASNIEVEYDE